MSDMPVSCCADKRKILQGTLIALCCIAIATRLYLYWHPKDIWMDEGMLFWALYEGSWETVLHGILENIQCCPVFFALYNKLLFPFSCTQHALYFLPTCTGIALVILFAALAHKIDGKIYAVICVMFFCSLEIFVYYSSEFKQYIFESFMTASAIYIYIYDLSSGDERRFLSWKYPLLMSISLLISNPSVFISAGLATTIALYLKMEKHFSLKSIAIIFLTRYSLFGIVCILYYFLYLKNGNSEDMHSYWQHYFFPTTLSAWPDYLRNVYFDGQGFWEYFGQIVIKSFVLLSSLAGAFFLCRKKRFVACALVTPFFFACIAGVQFYPLVLGASVSYRLSHYLLPILILFMGQVFLPPVRYLVRRMSTTCLARCSSLVVGVVLCFNMFFAVEGVGREYITPLIEKVVSQATAEDTVMVSEFTWSIWKYYTFLAGVDLPVTILPKTLAHASDDAIRAFFPESILAGKKTLYILYTFNSAALMDRMKAYLEKQGWRVDVCSPKKAQLQTIVLQETPAS